MKLSSLQRGLVGHWRLDKESLQSPTVFADKTPYENAAAKYGSVLKFDGAGDHVICGDIDLTTALTLATRIKLNSLPGSGSIAQIQSKGTWDQAYSTRVDSEGRLWIYLQGIYGMGSNATLSPGIFYDIVYTYNGSVLNLYIDGILDRSDAASGSITTNSNNVWLGGEQHAGGRWWFDGIFGDARIYSRELTPTEASILSRGGIVSDTGLVAHYTMKDKSGTTLTDETGTNNGTLTNFVDTAAEYGNTHDSGWVTDDTPNVFTLDRMGQADRALSFNGTSDYVDCGNGESLQITGGFTISAMVSVGTHTTTTGLVSKAGKPSNPTQLAYTLHALSGTGLIGFTISSTGSHVGRQYTAAAIDIGTGIHHVVCRFTPGQDIEIFLDGVNTNVAVGGAGAQPSIFNTPVNLSLGRFAVVNADMFHGSIPEVRIYNRPISQQEITMLSESYRPKVMI